jgi:hypothetical protein
MGRTTDGSELGSRIFSSPRRSDRLWGPPNLLSNRYRRLFLRGQSGRGVKLTTHLQLVQSSRKCGSIHPLPHTPSWCSAGFFKHRDNFTLPLPTRPLKIQRENTTIRVPSHGYHGQATHSYNILHYSPCETLLNGDSIRTLCYILFSKSRGCNTDGKIRTSQCRLFLPLSGSVRN